MNVYITFNCIGISWTDLNEMIEIYLLPILTTLFSLLRADTFEDEPNDLCATKSLDYAFNFIDPELHPNGIMVKQGDLLFIFNDGFLVKSWTKEYNILREFRNSESIEDNVR